WAWPGSMRMYLTNTGPLPVPGTRARLTGTCTAWSTGAGNGACAYIARESVASSSATAMRDEIFIFLLPETDGILSAKYCNSKTRVASVRRQIYRLVFL